jgi:TolA-binding protein
MKRNERHHLKENELLHMAASAREALETKSSQLGKIAIAVGLIAVLAIGYAVWRNRVQGRAGTLLADAMAVQDARVGPPQAPGTPASGPSYPTEKDKNQALLTKFKLVADQFPGTDAGIFARYREAGAHMALGNTKEAAAAYEQVIASGGDSLYVQMARLGLAEAQARGGEFDKAIEGFKTLSARTDSPLPVDGILMQLARAYRDAGKTADAQQTLDRIVKEFPESQYVSDAQRELTSMKKS